MGLQLLRQVEAQLGVHEPRKAGDTPETNQVC